MLEIDIRKIPVFWINLDADVVRWEAMLTFFDENKFENVTRVPGVIAHKRDADVAKLIGCSAAFVAAFDKAPVSNFIIMEDDCVPVQGFSPVVRMPEDTDAFYLGISQAGASVAACGKNYYLGLGIVQAVPVTSTVSKITNMLSAHSVYYRSLRYAAMCRTARKESIKREINGDILIALNMREHNVYANVRPAFYQHSNIEATNVEICNVT